MSEPTMELSRRGFEAWQAGSPAALRPRWIRVLAMANLVALCFTRMIPIEPVGASSKESPYPDASPASSCRRDHNTSTTVNADAPLWQGSVSAERLRATGARHLRPGEPSRPRGSEPS